MLSFVFSWDSNWTNIEICFVISTSSLLRKSINPLSNIRIPSGRKELPFPCTGQAIVQGDAHDSPPEHPEHQDILRHTRQIAFQKNTDAIFTGSKGKGGELSLCFEPILARIPSKEFVQEKERKGSAKYNIRNHLCTGFPVQVTDKDGFGQIEFLP